MLKRSEVRFTRIFRSCWKNEEKLQRELLNGENESLIQLLTDKTLSTNPVLRPLTENYAAVAAEKPNPTILLKAWELLEVKPEDALHIGDDRGNDLWSARDAGCDASLWGSYVNSSKECVPTWAVAEVTVYGTCVTSNKPHAITSFPQPFDKSESVPKMIKLKAKDYHPVQSQNMDLATNRYVRYEVCNVENAISSAIGTVSDKEDDNMSRTKNPLKSHVNQGHSTLMLCLISFVKYCHRRR
ncbi:hypothetical protein C5167_039414 [Papaver somniferum]|uniref:Uncharacterized protein n=1 Tax=Papaver somniferum TaxID=3469 RepID=A0A4Y7IFJ8_PAPSO|nr:hypothetical protein C5167_039414 [Papaver somniferum]